MGSESARPGGAEELQTRKASIERRTSVKQCCGYAIRTPTISRGAEARPHQYPAYRIACPPWVSVDFGRTAAAHDRQRQEEHDSIGSPVDHCARRSGRASA